MFRQQTHRYPERRGRQSPGAAGGDGKCPVGPSPPSYCDCRSPAVMDGEGQREGEQRYAAL